MSDMVWIRDKQLIWHIVVSNSIPLPKLPIVSILQTKCGENIFDKMLQTKNQPENICDKCNK